MRVAGGFLLSRRSIDVGKNVDGDGAAYHAKVFEGEGPFELWTKLARGETEAIASES